MECDCTSGRKCLNCMVESGVIPPHSVGSSCCMENCDDCHMDGEEDDASS